MGHGITAKCKNCRFTIDLFFGIGESEILLYETWLNELDCDSRRNVVERIGSKVAYISSWQKTAYRCPQCNYMFGYRKVDVVYGESEHLTTIPKCLRCNKEQVHEIGNADAVTEYPCPSCGRDTLEENLFILWD